MSQIVSCVVVEEKECTFGDSNEFMTDTFVEGIVEVLRHRHILLRMSKTGHICAQIDIIHLLLTRSALGRHWPSDERQNVMVSRGSRGCTEVSPAIRK